jgi:hypothetical protein
MFRLFLRIFSGDTARQMLHLAVLFLDTYSE